MTPADVTTTTGRLSAVCVVQYLSHSSCLLNSSTHTHTRFNTHKIYYITSVLIHSFADPTTVRRTERNVVLRTPKTVVCSRYRTRRAVLFVYLFIRFSFSYDFTSRVKKYKMSNTRADWRKMLKIIWFFVYKKRNLWKSRLFWKNARENPLI